MKGGKEQKRAERAENFFDNNVKSGENVKISLKYWEGQRIYVPSNQELGGHVPRPPGDDVPGLILTSNLSNLYR